MIATTFPSPAPTSPRGLPLLLAATGPIALGGLLAATSATIAPLFAVPAVVFGVVGATSPALYIATAATGAAPALSAVVRAFGVAIGAFGVALAGLLLPAAFLSLSSVSPRTPFLVASAAIAGAAWIALRRLARELGTSGTRTTGGSVVFAVWALATCGIAGRMWLDLAKEVAS